MKQAIAGVSPAQFAETTVATTWPSIAVFALGQRLGGWFAIGWPEISILRLGNLIALLAIPVALVLYFLRLVPGRGVRYRITNRRILIESALTYRELQSIALDGFDAITLEVLPGQDWFHAGNLVFQREGEPVFRLEGVSRPTVFRQTCIKSQQAFRGVQQILQPA